MAGTAGRSGRRAGMAVLLAGQHASRHQHHLDDMWRSLCLIRLFRLLGRLEK